VSTTAICDKVYVVEDGSVRQKRGEEELVMAG
jgi:ABC-type lipopolysaccharide export system ATPase subunit